MVLEEKSTMPELLQAQVDRIVHSEQFRSSEVLRRLLNFLTERSLSGEADNLKEYVVAIDGLGKAASYDPQHNSAVRIQMGRLRQRLAEYYRSEGKDDPIVVDLPKGRFRLTFEQRSEADAIVNVNNDPRILAASSMPELAAMESELRKQSWLGLRRFTGCRPSRLPGIHVGSRCCHAPQSWLSHGSRT
jgi:hypothetical protein